MKSLSVIGLLFVTAIIATVPISPQVTPRGIELSVDQAQAQITYGQARRMERRADRYDRRADRRADRYDRRAGYTAAAAGGGPRLWVWLSSSSSGPWKVVHDLSKWFPLVLDTDLTPAPFTPDATRDLAARCGEARLNEAGKPSRLGPPECGRGTMNGTGGPAANASYGFTTKFQPGGLEEPIGLPALCSTDNGFRHAK